MPYETSAQAEKPDDKFVRLDGRWFPLNDAKRSPECPTRIPAGSKVWSERKNLVRIMSATGSSPCYEECTIPDCPYGAGRARS